MDVLENLNAGLDYLDEFGWHKGGIENSETKEVCAVGAVVKTDPARHTFYCAVMALQAQLPEDFTPDRSVVVHDVAQYNDLPSTTEEDIRLLFKKAIYAEENP
jgi:hypothetical protein